MRITPQLLGRVGFWTLLHLTCQFAFGQSPQLDQPVSVACREQSIAKVLADLQSRYHIPFAYFGQPAAFEHKMTLELREQPLRTVLDTLLARTEITYQLVAGQIVLKTKEASPSYLSISGKVVEEATGDPIPFAAIRLQRGSSGTVANEDGKFSFHFPAPLTHDTLVISRLGYRNYAAPVAHIVANGSNLFRLKPDTVQLGEVTIPYAPLTAAQLVDSAVANILLNFPLEPYNLSLFYRETLKEGGTYVSLSEAAALLFDEKGYWQPRGRFADEKIQLIKARGVRYQPQIGPNQWVNHLSAMLEKNAVKYRESYLKNRRYAHYQRLPDETWNGKPAYVVTAANPRYKVTIWIEAERYAIIKYVLESQPTATFISGTDRKDSDSTFTAATHNQVINEFREYGGKWYPQYLQWSYTHQRFDKRTSQPIPASKQSRRLGKRFWSMVSGITTLFPDLFLCFSGNSFPKLRFQGSFFL